VIGVFHLKDGKVTDYWDQPDLLNMLGALGARQT
jgi:hypothetical protein